MYSNVNADYLAAVEAGILPSNATITGTISLKNGTVINLNNSNIITNSLNINNKCCSSSKLEIGSVYIGECSFKLLTSLYLYDLYDGEVTLYYNALGNQIPLGVYYISEVTRTSKFLNVTAYDAMNFTDKSIGNLTVNGSPYDVVNWICTNCGITFGNTSSEINSMANGDKVLNVSSNSYSSFRDALSDAAAVLGGFATINRLGQLEIRSFATTPSGTVTPRKRKSQTISEYQTKITTIEISVSGVTYTATVGDDGLTYIMSNKMIVGLGTTIQNMVDSILNSLKNLEYTPGDIGIIYDPRYDLGDLITIKADTNNILDPIQEDINVLITSISYTFQGSSNIKGVGENIFLSKRIKSSSSDGSYDSAVSYAKNNGTYIEAYENISAYSIGQSNISQEVVSIDYGNGESDVVVLNGQCCINCTTPGAIQIVYKKDDEDESFSPKLNLVEGYNTIDFYCYYLKPEKNWISKYQIELVSLEDNGTYTEFEIAIGDIRASVTASMFGNGKFLVNNYFEEILENYYNNNYTLEEIEQGEE